MWSAVGGQPTRRTCACVRGASTVCSREAIASTVSSMAATMCCRPQPAGPKSTPSCTSLTCTCADPGIAVLITIACVLMYVCLRLYCHTHIYTHMHNPCIRVQTQHKKHMQTHSTAIVAHFLTLTKPSHPSLQLRDLRDRHCWRRRNHRPTRGCQGPPSHRQHQHVVRHTYTPNIRTLSLWLLTAPQHNETHRSHNLQSHNNPSQPAITPHTLTPHTLLLPLPQAPHLGHQPHPTPNRAPPVSRPTRRARLPRHPLH